MCKGVKTTGHLDDRQILYISGSADPDYLSALTLHGFKELYGSKCHDCPKIPYIYKTDTIKYATLYGKGLTYTNLLDLSNHNSELDNSVVDDM